MSDKNLDHEPCDLDKLQHLDMILKRIIEIAKTGEAQDIEYLNGYLIETSSKDGSLTCWRSLNNDASQNVKVDSQTKEHELTKTTTNEEKLEQNSSLTIEKDNLQFQPTARIRLNRLSKKDHEKVNQILKKIYKDLEFFMKENTEGRKNERAINQQKGLSIDSAVEKIKETVAKNKAKKSKTPENSDKAGNGLKESSNLTSKLPNEGYKKNDNSKANKEKYDQSKQKLISSVEEKFSEIQEILKDAKVQSEAKYLRNSKDFNLKDQPNKLQEKSPDKNNKKEVSNGKFIIDTLSSSSDDDFVNNKYKLNEGEKNKTKSKKEKQGKTNMFGKNDLNLGSKKGKNDEVSSLSTSNKIKLENIEKKILNDETKYLNLEDNDSLEAALELNDFFSDSVSSIDSDTKETKRKDSLLKEFGINRKKDKNENTKDTEALSASSIDTRSPKKDRISTKNSEINAAKKQQAKHETSFKLSQNNLNQKEKNIHSNKIKELTEKVIGNTNEKFMNTDQRNKTTQKPNSVTPKMGKVTHKTTDFINGFNGRIKNIRA
jgi:hypothetical protein